MDFAIIMQTTKLPIGKNIFGRAFKINLCFPLKVKIPHMTVIFSKIATETTVL